MSDAYQIKNQEGVYFLTFQVVSWVDLFSRRRYKDILVDSLNTCIRHKGLQVYSWCIMSNHVHCILSAQQGNLSSVIRDFKSHTSKQILTSVKDEPESRREWMLFQFKRAAQQHLRNINYQVWTHENHAVELTTPDITTSKLNYIHQNPVKEGYVEEAEHYLYSSARDYADGKGLISIVHT
ncbi:MAG: transposase [Chitinophagaceae bacterium]|nr:transposase [Chitinophagaceae bacterium]